MCNCKDKNSLADDYRLKRTPHVHADVIKAWAEGHTVQVCCNNFYGSEWVDCHEPLFHSYQQYRVKPEPKPPTDLEKYGVEEGDVWLWREGSAYCSGLVNFVSTRMWYTVIGNGQKFAVLLQDSPLVDGELRFRRGVVNKL